jgi:membrane-bound lytic murein transglycosylase A
MAAGRLGLVALALVLSACSARIVPPAQGPAPQTGPSVRPTPTPAAKPSPTAEIANAVAAGVVAGPPVRELPLSPDQAVRALAAFRTSCPSLISRNDATGLTQAADWQPVCSAAATTADDEARAFFDRYFETVQVGDGKAFATGYYEPEIAGSRDRQPGYAVPIYGRPTDLVDVDLGLFTDTLKGRKIRGRVEGTNFVPYHDRTAIETGAIERSAPIIAWAADPVEIFFLQIQGSGRLRLPDGGIMRIGYDSQNGRDYTGIGALMRQRGLLQPGQTSMQGIVAWLRTHPEEGKAIMRENKSFVFFREQQTAAKGALGYVVTGGVSAAVDPKFVPLGAPIFLAMDRPDASRLWIAQDTGGAIRGTNRVDTFWGAGPEASTIAGGMSARGTAFVLVPRGTLARLFSAPTALGSPNGGAPINR